MDFRSLEEVAGQLKQRRVSFSSLMPWRVRNILIVSSLYDSFTFQEDGDLTEMLVSEYLELNLSYAPAIDRVSTAAEAIRRVREDPPDLLVSMPRVGGMDIYEFSRQVKAIAPELPLVLLAYDTRELALIEARPDPPAVERIFVWQGDARLFLAIIKHIEDRINARHDADMAGVKCIILVEDSVRFYSAYLPMLYTEIVKQTQSLMAESVNRMQQLIRMRARPKILLATSFEEGAALVEQYREHMLGVIVDARFPRAGQSDPEAGRRFIELVKQADPAIPVLMQSSEAANEEVALRLGATFLDKGSETLLHRLRHFLATYLGFGDFIFRHPDGTLISSAHDLRGLVERLQTIPDASLLYHACRNDFSTWLMARTEFDLAKALRPRKPEEFDSAGALRNYLLQALETYRGQSQAGLVAEFSPRHFDGRRFTRIGAGSLGGKGRGLAFIHSLLNAYEIEEQLPDVRIFVPPTVVLATGVFDRFMEESHLSALALEEPDDVRIRAAFLAAKLPEETREALRTLLAQVTHPLAVRSSSLLEDSSHQPFAGIYQTFMLPNDHADIQVRLDELCRAIRLVYASTYYADSKSYIESTPNRLEEEKMAVVIQEIVGRRHGRFLYPDAAGVARSYNYYPLDSMQAGDGIASVALGLGRTVVEGGRCVRFSPAAPGSLYQFSTTAETLENAQRQFFALDFEQPAPGGGRGDQPDANLILLDLDAAAEHGTLEAVGSVYSAENDRIYEGTHRGGIKLVTMAGLLSGTPFRLAETLKFLLEVCKAGFSCHVEMEFAVNLRPAGHRRHQFAILQVRPLVLGSATGDLDLARIEPRRAICISGAALGHGAFEDIADLVYVRPEGFDRGRMQEIAAEMGRVNGRLREEHRPYVLIGPGRWGSADRWLGIPVSWSQISQVGCIVEDELRDIKVAPSQGTHFFQNITSFGIGYFTLDSRDSCAHLDHAWLNAQEAVWESEHLRHLRFPSPLAIAVDARQGLGVILKPGESFTPAAAGRRRVKSDVRCGPGKTRPRR
ncbi:MAG: PEP/pyruvate-binding domain-containing protein [Candidatus Eisenbacteria bacterium]